MTYFKNKQHVTVEFGFDGGLNTSMHATGIGENEMSTAYNVMYDPGTGRLMTRPSLRCDAVAKLSKAITCLIPFVRKESESWLLCVSDKKLYKYTETTTGDTTTTTWELVGAVASDRPAYQVFAGKLYLADGSEDGLLSYDGTTLARVAGSPESPTALCAIAGRLVTNSGADTELDAVYFSEAQDGSAWNTQDGAISLRVGYGDGLKVNAFGVIGDYLVVSKMAVGASRAALKCMYGINVAGQTSAWSSKKISANNCAVNAHCIIGQGQDLLYLDNEGIERLSTTQEYGDLANDPVIGNRLSRFFRSRITADSISTFMAESGVYGCVFIADANFFIVYSKITGSFTEIFFSTGISAIVDYSGETYLAGEDGYLYTFSIFGGDEVAPNELVDVISYIKTKLMAGTGALLLLKSTYYFDYLAPGKLQVFAVKEDDITSTPLSLAMPVSPDPGNDYLYDANYELASVQGGLEMVANSIPQKFSSRQRFRADGIALSVRTTGKARVMFNQITADFAQVGR